jgi:TolB-like protein
MKAKIWVIVFFFTAFSVFGQGRNLSIDEATRAAARYLSEHIPGGTKIAVVNFTATKDVSDYVVAELTSRLVNTRKFTVVDRYSLALIEREMNFQLSGEVSDESAQAIGRKLGAQTIISGSLRAFGNLYRMEIKALEVETAKILGSETYTIRKDSVLNNLMPSQPAARPVRQDTTGSKIGTGALNIMLGLGSYIEGDVAGGLTVTGGYALSAGLILIEAFVMDWDNPAVGVPGTIGFSVAGLTLVYGFIRPFFYKPSSSGYAVLDNTQVEIVPMGEGMGIRLAYTIRF